MVRKKRSLGFGFADEVARISGKKSKFNRINSDEWKDFLIPNFADTEGETVEKSPWIKTLFVSFLIVCTFAVIIRLTFLQIIKGEDNRKLADGNRIQTRTIHAPRGVIYDRNGKVLAGN